MGNEGFSAPPWSLVSRPLPLIPVRGHPHAHVGLALEEAREKLPDLRRPRELLDPLEARPRVDTEERLRILGIQIDRVGQVSSLLRRVLGRFRDLVVIAPRGRWCFSEPPADRDRVLHHMPPAERDRPLTSL